MRSTDEAAAVRLYHLDPDSGVATTLLYGALVDALAAAAAESEEVREALFLQTRDDVVGYRELLGG